MYWMGTDSPPEGALLRGTVRHSRTCQAFSIVKVSYEEQHAAMRPTCHFYCSFDIVFTVDTRSSSLSLLLKVDILRVFTPPNASATLGFSAIAATTAFYFHGKTGGGKSARPRRW